MGVGAAKDVDGADDGKAAIVEPLIAVFFLRCQGRLVVMQLTLAILEGPLDSRLRRKVVTLEDQLGQHTGVHEAAPWECLQHF